MTKPLVFTMGPSLAILPVDRHYTTHHMWLRSLGEGEGDQNGDGQRREYRFGLSAYAVRLLGDLERLEWNLPAGTEVQWREPIAVIEGSKAVSELYAPFAGRLLGYQPAIVAQPSLLNADPYDPGWLFTLACSPGEILTAEQYVEHLKACWPVAQRVLKGQLLQSGGPDRREKTEK